MPLKNLILNRFSVCVKLVCFVVQLHAVTALEQIYMSTNDDRCIPANVNPLNNYASIFNARQCSAKCLINSNCALFMVDSVTSSCLLYPAMYYSYYLNVSYYKPKQCEIWFAYWKQKGSVIFKSSGLFTVPGDVNYIKALAVGGGAGACNGNYAAGGSGYVSYGAFYVSAGQNITITVGKGGIGQRTLPDPHCINATNGGNSTFGSIFAQGGLVPKSPFHDGADGGSGGGGATSSLSNARSGSGGSSGSNGTSGSTSYAGGKGQGASFTSPFSQFSMTNISAGSGAAGLYGAEPLRNGGGGAGGVLFNGTGPKAGGGGCLSNDALACGPGNATGYGASGSSGCRKSTSEYSSGGNGADGVVYIEFYFF